MGVVVPVHDEEELLPGALDALATAVAVLREAVPAVSVEIVVVLDACTDASVTACAGRPDVVTVRSRRRCVGAARARGCALALGRSPVPAEATWLACTDADSRVPADWLCHHRGLADTGVDAVLGAVAVRDWTGWPPHVPAAYATAYRAAVRGVDGHDHVHGANLGVRGSAYLTAGGFRALRSDEDVALVGALRRTGARVAATRGAPVETSARRVGRTPQGFSGHLRALAAGPPDEGSSPCRPRPRWEPGWVMLRP
jgi:hypothetical protein